MKEKTVQILMTTYNGEKYLKEQLDSLLAQVGVSVKILVRDDGSTDSTTSILNSYKSTGLVDWYSSEHLGAPRGFLDLINKSLEADYYAFCDQDDVWDKDKLQVATNTLSQHIDSLPLLYYSGLRAVDDNLSPLFVHRLDVKRSMRTNFLMSNIAGCTAVFNKRLKDILSFRFPRFFQMHDNWVLMVCLSVGGIVEVDPNPHISYRQHGNNTVGIGNSIISKFKEAHHYIVDRRIKDQCVSLVECYGDEMTPEYRKFVQQICEYDSSFRNKVLFAFFNDFNYHSFSLNLLMRFKILIGKL